MSSRAAEVGEAHLVTDTRGGLPPVPEQRSAMLTRFGALAQLLIRFAFRHVQIPEDAVARVRDLAAEGTVIYVMRYRSVIDYLLVNAVLLRERLPLSTFAPGVSLVWCRRLGDLFRLGWHRRAPGPRADHAACAGLVAAGKPVLLFMRNRSVVARRRTALMAARIGPRFLRDVLRGASHSSRPVFLVPIAIFRGAGPRRKESRFTALLYTVQDAPGEAKRLFTYLWNAEQTRLVVGRELVLSQFVEEHARESEDRIARRLARALQIFLYREERVVWGPALLPRRIVREQVVRDPELARLIRRLANERGVPRRIVLKEARRYVEEMAANFKGFYFGILELLFNRIWPRVFGGLEINGLERTIECVKQHPVVLVPAHRSHFDYLILSYIFHSNYLSPPHIAAGINLSFWPMGPLFRGAGAFFIRRTFEDNELYKMVFRKYLAFLIREGYTQEFFIEGGRTRTGKILPPKLGMLSAIVQSFVSGLRRDLYLVPISLHYGRIPEEEAYTREIRGEEKQRESLGALLRARSILQRRFGTAYVSFAEPVSLADALGPARERLQAGAGTPETEDDMRRFVQRLGFRLLRDINSAAVAGATAVSATALLGAPRRACRLEEFLRASSALLALLRLQNVCLTASLVRNEASGFRESLAWLEGGGLIERLVDGDGVVLHVPTAKRTNLDYYKNNTIHFFLLPALVARALWAGVHRPELVQTVAWWLDLYRWEFPLPAREGLAAEVTSWVAHLEALGALHGDRLDGTHPVSQVLLGVLENFREGYLVAARTVAGQRQWPVEQGALVDGMRRQFATGRLLGEIHKPEGNSVVIFGNALLRLGELGMVGVTRRGRRERWFDRGPSFDRISELVRQLRV